MVTLEGGAGGALTSPGNEQGKDQEEAATVIQASRGTGCRSRKKLTCERNTGDTPKGSQTALLS